MATPRDLRSRMRPKRRSTASSKRALVGSSMRRMRAFMLSARAMARSWRCPMGRVSTGAARAAVQPHLRKEGRAEGVEGTAGVAEIAERDVLADGEGREEVELLVDDADAEALGVAGMADFDGAAVDLNPGGVGLGDAGEDAREGALARAVLADQGVDFAAAEREACAAERPDAAVVFGDAFGLEDWIDARSIAPNAGIGLEYGGERDDPLSQSAEVLLGFGGGGAAGGEAGAQLLVGNAAEVLHEPADVVRGDAVLQQAGVLADIAPFQLAILELHEVVALAEEVVGVPFRAGEELPPLAHGAAPIVDEVVEEIARAGRWRCWFRGARRRGRPCCPNPRAAS